MENEKQRPSASGGSRGPMRIYSDQREHLPYKQVVLREGNIWKIGISKNQTTKNACPPLEEITLVPARGGEIRDPRNTLITHPIRISTTGKNGELMSLQENSPVWTI